MNIGLRILAVLLPLMAGACAKSGTIDTAAPDEAARPGQPSTQTADRTFQLESLYLSTSVRLMNDAPSARFISLSLSEISTTEMIGTLMLDPNTCSLDVFGDREACTRIAARAIRVELQLVRLVDPQRARRYFEIIGEGLPKGLALIVRGDLQEGELERAYLKLGVELVPLFFDERE